MADKKDRFEDVLNNGVDFKNRRIYFGSIEDSDSDVDWYTTEKVIRALHKMSETSSTEPITLYVNSYGGSVEDAFALVDEIESFPCEIHFVGGGKIMSAATIIMAACDYRSIHKNTSVMIHEIQDAGIDVGVADAKIQLKYTMRLMDQMIRTYAENSAMPEAFWRDMCERDVYLTAREALTLGLVDSIIEPLDRSEFRSKREESRQEFDTKDIQKVVGSVYSRIGHKNTPKIVVKDKS